MSKPIEPGVCCQEYASTLQSQLDEAVALLRHAGALLRHVAVPPEDGAPSKEVATWLLAQEGAIDFLKEMGWWEHPEKHG